jgi:hypothetical protein
MKGQERREKIGEARPSAPLTASKAEYWPVEAHPLLVRFFHNNNFMARKGERKNTRLIIFKNAMPP